MTATAMFNSLLLRYVKAISSQTPRGSQPLCCDKSVTCHNMIYQSFYVMRCLGGTMV